MSYKLLLIAAKRKEYHINVLPGGCVTFILWILGLIQSAAAYLVLSRPNLPRFCYAQDDQGHNHYIPPDFDLNLHSGLWHNIQLILVDFSFDWDNPSSLNSFLHIIESSSHFSKNCRVSSHFLIQAEKLSPWTPPLTLTLALQTNPDPLALNQGSYPVCPQTHTKHIHTSKLLLWYY